MNKTTEALNLAEALENDAKEHREVSYGLDCPPERTANWKHALNCEAAARLIREALAEQSKCACDSPAWCTKYNKCNREVLGLPKAQPVKQEPVAIVVSEHTHSEYASIKYLADRRLPCKTKLYTTLIEPVEQEPVAEVVLRNQIIGFGRTDERKDIKFLADVDIGSKLYSVPVRTKDLTSEDIDDAYEAAGKKFKSWQQSVHGQMMSEHDFFVTYFAHELITKYKELNK